MEANTADIQQEQIHGQAPVFAEVVEAYQSMVYNIALGILQQAEDAEDVLQEVFVKVYENWDNFSGDSERGTWIYRIAANMAMDARRKSKAVKRGGLLKRVFGMTASDVPASFHHPGVQLDEKENSEILFAALNRIPEKQMLAFLLQQLEGQQVKEIAQIMDTTSSAVESLLKRAKENLRKEIITQTEYKP